MPVTQNEIGAASVVAGAATGGIGAPVVVAAGAVYNVVSNVIKTIGGAFKGSPPVEWTQSNELSFPIARDLTALVVDTVKPENVQKVFSSYVAKLKNYIDTSPHNPTQTDNFIRAVDVEAVGCGGGFRVEYFPFDVTLQDQLAWAIWLHAMWLFGGVSQDEVSNGGAYSKFKASLEPTLVAAVGEVTVYVLDTTKPTTPVNTAGNVPAVKKSSIASSPLVMFLLIGVAVGLVYFAAKGK